MVQDSERPSWVQLEVSWMSCISQSYPCVFSTKLHAEMQVKAVAYESAWNGSLISVVGHYYLVRRSLASTNLPIWSPNGRKHGKYYYWTNLIESRRNMCRASWFLDASRNPGEDLKGARATCHSYVYVACRLFETSFRRRWCIYWGLFRTKTYSRLCKHCHIISIIESLRGANAVVKMCITGLLSPDQVQFHK